jgi:hypothetical protein
MSKLKTNSQRLKAICGEPLIAVPRSQIYPCADVKRPQHMDEHQPIYSVE